MAEACRALVHASEPLKRWTTADATYARRVQEEIGRHNRRQRDLKDIVKQLEDQRDQQAIKVKKTSQNVIKVIAFMTSLT